VPNPNVVVLEEIFEEENFENFDQEANIIQDEILESVQMDEGESSFYIFNEQEEPDILTRKCCTNKSTSKQIQNKRGCRKRKRKDKRKCCRNNKTTNSLIKQKNPQQMTYNVIDDLTKLRITFPFMEVVKIPQQRENILKILDEPSTRIEVVVTNSRQHTKFYISQAKG
jgi:hypothetical protein